jgi:hypothetical protein
MNKKTRKLRSRQRGGYIISPMNPYFMTTAALIGGLYVLGQFQSSKTDAEPTAAPSQSQGQSGGRKFRRTRKKKAGTIKEMGKLAEKLGQFMSGGRKTRRRNKRRRNKRKKGTRRRKQKGGDRELRDMVVDLTLMFLPRRVHMSNFNDKHDLKNEIIHKVKTTNDMGDLEGGLMAILELFLDENGNGNYEIENYDSELKDQLKEILEVMCERPDLDCSNPYIQDILQ